VKINQINGRGSSRVIYNQFVSPYRARVYWFKCNPCPSTIILYSLLSFNDSNWHKNASTKAFNWNSYLFTKSLYKP